jgi:hypothetical protein
VEVSPSQGRRHREQCTSRSCARAVCFVRSRTWIYHPPNCGRRLALPRWHQDAAGRLRGGSFRYIAVFCPLLKIRIERWRAGTLSTWTGLLEMRASPATATFQLRDNSPRGSVISSREPPMKQLLVFAVCVVARAQHQSSVSGMVIDFSTGAPLAKADVVLLGGPAGAYRRAYAVVTEEEGPNQRVGRF